jgi:hypothetical protein
MSAMANGRQRECDKLCCRSESGGCASVTVLNIAGPSGGSGAARFFHCTAGCSRLERMDFFDWFGVGEGDPIRVGDDAQGSS